MNKGNLKLYLVYKSVFRLSFDYVPPKLLNQITSIFKSYNNVKLLCNKGRAC